MGIGAELAMEVQPKVYDKVYDKDYVKVYDKVWKGRHGPVSRAHPSMPRGTTLTIEPAHGALTTSSLTSVAL